MPLIPPKSHPKQQIYTSHIRTLFEDAMLRLVIQFKKNCEQSKNQLDEVENCMGTVIFSWSFLEAYINHFLNNRFPRIVKDIEPGEFERLSTIKKYIFLSKIASPSGKTFLKGEDSLLDSFRLLGEIRNKILHYKAKTEEIGYHIKPKEFEIKCRNLFKIREQDSDILRKILTKECADWSLRTNVNVVKQFEDDVFGENFVHSIFKKDEFKGIK